MTLKTYKKAYPIIGFLIQMDIWSCYAAFDISTFEFMTSFSEIM